MARQAQKNAQSTYNAAQGVQSQGSALENQALTNSNAIFNALMPQYEAEATNPSGYGASGIAAMDTAAQQSTGGSTAGAVGKLNQMAARTRNKGGFQIAGDEAARQGARQNSQEAVQVQSANEQLKQQQKQAGLVGEAGLYGENLSTILGALGAENSSLGQQTGANNSEVNAGNSGWLQNTMGLLGSLGSLGSGVGAAAKGICWIAAELYGGWNDPRVSIVREWLLGDFSRSILGRVVVALYRRFGERVARMMRRSVWLRSTMRRLFDAALRKAS